MSNYSFDCSKNKFRDLKNANYSHKYRQKKIIVENYLDSKVDYKKKRFYIDKEELSKANGLCDV